MIALADGKNRFALDFTSIQVYFEVVFRCMGAFGSSLLTPIETHSISLFAPHVVANGQPGCNLTQSL